MFVIFAVDALEYNKVEEYACENLMQSCYGKTDITEFSEPRTMVLWSSFITGENKESEVLEDGNREMWNKTWDIGSTFFKFFKNPAVIDLPGFSYDLYVHEESRKLLKSFFTAENPDEKEKVKQDYNKQAFEHHKNVKAQFYKALKGSHDLVLGYFSLIDVIGHLNFGSNTLMKMIYKEFDEIARDIKSKTDNVLVISDHGMKAIGNFGDHSEYGFWSSGKLKLDNPKITDFFDVVRNNF
jgi:hypothetical protein